MSKSGFKKFLIGAGIGTAIGILFATKPGKETRKELREKFDELESKLKDIDFDNLKEEVTNKLSDLKEYITDLDQEKLASATKEKIVLAKDKVSDLGKVVLKKSNPKIKALLVDLTEKLDDLDSKLN